MQATHSKAEKTRQFIIETTADIFNKKGYAGTSMADLTEATGLTKGSIYGNFENKEEVALAVFDYNYSRIRTEIKRRMGLAPSFREKLLVYTDVYNHYTLRSFPEGGCPILNTAIEADDTHPLLKGKAAAAVTKWQKTIQLLIKSGIAAGEFKKETDPLQLANSIVALIEGGIMISRVTDDRTALHRVVKTVVQLIDMISSK